jgi:hypothetical protein
MRGLFYLLIFLQFNNLISQNLKQIEGSWIKKNLTEEDKKSPLKYTFTKNKLYISTKYTYLGREYDLKIKNNHIYLPFITLFIEQLDDENLKVVEINSGDFKSKYTPIIFIREETYLRNINLKECAFYVKDQDTIYKDYKSCYATMNKYIDYSDISLKYTFDNSSQWFVYATYVIDENGNVNDINVLHHVDKKIDKEIYNRISATNKKWKTHKIGGKSIKIQSNIIYGNQFHNEYADNFIFAMNFIEKNSFEDAIIALKKCRELIVNKANIDYHLYLTYQKIGRKKEAEIHKSYVLKSTLSYLLN